MLEQTCEITLIVPTEYADAGYLYRRGNQVRIRLGELHTTWRAKQAELQGDMRALG